MTEDELLAYLKRSHTGLRCAVSSRALEARFHIRGWELREAVNALRRAGHPVCSGGNGYFYAGTERELSDTIRQLSSRIGRIAEAKRGLDRARSLFPDESGQTALPLYSQRT